MPRYFFHIKEGDKVTADEEGEEFDTLETVRKVAVESAREIMSQDVLNGRAPNGRTFVIADETGRTALALAFKEALDH